MIEYLGSSAPVIAMQAALSVRCQDAPLPELSELTWEQAQGRACWPCGKFLPPGAVARGGVSARHGTSFLDTPVWSCPAPEATP